MAKKYLSYDNLVEYDSLMKNDINKRITDAINEVNEKVTMVVTVNGNGSSATPFSADKTFAEIHSHLTNGGYVVLMCSMDNSELAVLFYGDEYITFGETITCNMDNVPLAGNLPPIGTMTNEITILSDDTVTYELRIFDVNTTQIPSILTEDKTIVGAINEVDAKSEMIVIVDYDETSGELKANIPYADIEAAYASGRTVSLYEVGSLDIYQASQCYNTRGTIYFTRFYRGREKACCIDYKEKFAYVDNIEYQQIISDELETVDKTIVGAINEVNDKVNIQSDWNVNDETSKAYIANRTHYEIQNTDVAIIDAIFSTIYNYNSKHYYMNLNVEKEKLIAGNTYTVIYNGVEYNNLECCNNEYDTPYLGAAYTDDGTYDFTTYPFSIEFGIYGTAYFNFVIAADGGTIDSSNNTVTNLPPQTFKIITTGNKYVELDEKYISYKPGKNTFGMHYTIDGAEVTAEAHAEVFNDYENNIASGLYSHAEGSNTVASGQFSHAEGSGAVASGYTSHAEGDYTTASGENSHAEGDYTLASERNSHAEGYNTKASGWNSHSEGDSTTASGSHSHSEGISTIASGNASHAENSATKASGDFSHAEGRATIASGENQHVQGKFNKEDTANKYAHIVGNGAYNARSNAHTVDWNGNGWYQGDVYVGGTSQDDGKKLATEEYVQQNGGVQSDWNVNDETSKAYVANRTHYHNKKEYRGESLGTLSATFTANASYSIDMDDDFSLGNSSCGYVEVVFDGVSEICEVGKEITGINTSVHSSYFDYSFKAFNSTITVYSDGKHTIEMYDWIIEETLVKLDEKFIPESIARVSDIPSVPELTNPDWNQMDDSATDYIKNRTHYTYISTEKNALCDEFTGTFTAGTQLSIPYSDLIQYEAQTLIVVWDGLEYNCVLTYDVNFAGASWETCTLGDENLTEYPFFIYYYGGLSGTISYALASTDGQHTFCIYKTASKENVVQLDEKYIPDAIARKSYVDENFVLKSEIENIEFITIDDIDAICGVTIKSANEVMF